MRTRVVACRRASLAIIGLALAASGPANATLIFNTTFNDSAMSSAGLTAGQIASVHTAFNAATTQLTNNYNDPIHINITVTAVSGTGTLGSSNTFLSSVSYANLVSKFLADSKTANDATAVG